MILKTLEVQLSQVGVLRGADDHVLVACSGGLDSTVLAHATVQLLGARRVVLGHVDHAVREGSAADAERVRALAHQLGAEATVTRLLPGSDDEARLRNARYRALEDQRLQVAGQCIIVAHTLDDQAETILLRLLRTTDPSCFAGMPARRGVIIRPFLGLSRSDLAAYAVRHHLTFIEDPSNREPRYLRNRLRKELLPLIESRYRAGFARRLAEGARVLESGAAVQKRDDGARTSPGRAPEPPPWRVQFARIPWVSESLPDGRDCAVFDAALLGAPSVRPYRPGDRVDPWGMHGSRKVADVLREGGIPADNRRFIPVVVDEEDNVVWVPGHVRGRTAPVSASTDTAWVLTVRRDALQGAGLRAKVRTSAPDAADFRGPSSKLTAKGRKR